jgi:hypothetical protein
MRVTDMTHPDEGFVNGHSHRGDEDLAFVRRQLNRLADARSMSVLRPQDSARYLELCEKEQVLLGRQRR